MSISTEIYFAIVEIFQSDYSITFISLDRLLYISLLKHFTGKDMIDQRLAFSWSNQQVSEASEWRMAKWNQGNAKRYKFVIELEQPSIIEMLYIVLTEIGISPTVVRQDINQLPGLHLL